MTKILMGKILHRPPMFLNSLQKQKETRSRKTTVLNVLREMEKEREREKEGKNSENCSRVFQIHAEEHEMCFQVSVRTIQTNS